MLPVRTSSASTRLVLASLLALLLACRLLAPAGFMPSFDHGAITIVACPDAELPAPTMLGHHQHGRSKTQHQPCPFASASGLSSIAAVFAPLVSLLILAAALVLGRTYLFLERSRAHERPPLRGPPLLA